MTKLSYECHLLGDSAIVIRLGADIDVSILNQVHQVAAYIENNRFEGFIEIVSAYTTITIYYDGFQVYNHYSEEGTSRRSGRDGLTNTLFPCDFVLLHIQHLLDNYENEDKDDGIGLKRIIEIPVCYSEDYGPDLADVAAYHHVSKEEIVHLHTSQIYPVYMIGFAPGFPYLGGLNDKLATPRKSVPRTRVPVGSVGIGGAQTGIYPFETPGGWNLIGRTPLALFRPEFDPPSLLKVGDQVRFVSITAAEFQYEEERNTENGL
ncbi:5-oxoprolinase subunit PxpB [Paenibacillus sp. TAF58]